MAVLHRVIDGGGRIEREYGPGAARWISWQDRLFTREVEHRDRKVRIVGC